MSDWQYKTVALNGYRAIAADKHSKARAVVLSVDDFAQQMEQVINDLSLDGWEFLESADYAAGACILLFRKPGSVGRSYTDR